MAKSLAVKGRSLVAANLDRAREVSLRLSNATCKHRPGLDIIACYGQDNKTTRNRELAFSTIERLGYFDSTVNADGKKICLLNIAKIRQYMAEGCHTTEPVWRLLGMSGAFPVHPGVYLQAAKHQYIDKICPPAPEESATDMLIKFSPSSKSKGNQPTPLNYQTNLLLTKKFKMDEKYLGGQDWFNHVRGEGVTTGGFSSMSKAFRKLEREEKTVSHIQKAKLQELYVRTYWEHNHYLNTGGRIDNFKQDRMKAQEIINTGRERYWFTRTVRKTDLADPFLFSQAKVLRKENENTTGLNAKRLN